MAALISFLLLLIAALFVSWDGYFSPPFLAIVKLPLTQLPHMPYWVSVLHEHWHIEDWIQTRQTMGWKAPKALPTDTEQRAVANAWGGTFKLDRTALEADLIESVANGSSSCCSTEAFNPPSNILFQMRSLSCHRYGRTDSLEEQTIRNHVIPNATSSHDRVNGAGGKCGEVSGDVFIPGGLYMLGGVPSQPWVFDAERYAHPVVISPFEISKAPVTNAE